tara:strand:+ start:1503 stop:1760 length:258 start_codon:yes stop_codon:yes gene_type:complete
MLVVRCRECGKELTGQGNQVVSCGCPNMTTVKGDSVTAVDLTRVVMLSSNHKTSKTKQGVLSDNDLMFQEERRKRKVRKLDFEVR